MQLQVAACLKREGKGRELFRFKTPPSGDASELGRGHEGGRRGGEGTGGGKKSDLERKAASLGQLC